MSPSDKLPSLVEAYETRGDRAQELLDEVLRHVGWVTRPYPDAYFVLGRKGEEGVTDLGHRVFTTCARVEKGRFPFQGRTPFRSYVDEAFDGRAIRYHSFYAKLSITREILRDDYARNLRRDPVLKWRAELYKSIGAVLKARCTSLPQGRGLPPRWDLAEAKGLRAMRSLEVVQGQLRELKTDDIETLVLAALKGAGPLTQARLTHVLEAVLGTPEAEEPPEPVVQARSETQLAVRRAVVAGWQALDEADRNLLAAIARGDSYDELIARDERFKHRVAVTRAVARVGKGFLARVLEEAGLEDAADVKPKELMEHVLEVLVEVVPEIGGGAHVA